MNNDIETLIKACTSCLEISAKQQQETRVEKETPFAPMSHSGTDLFELEGDDWLVAVDDYSGWPFAAKMTTTTTEAVCKQLSAWFDNFGWPTRIRSDGGPQFRSSFSDFFRQRSTKHDLASAMNPRSNGLAEAGVKAIKHLLIKSDTSNINSLLAAYRNAPRADGYSPAELMLGRKMKLEVPLPMLQIHFEPNGELFKEGREKREALRQKVNEAPDEKAKDLTPLKEGQMCVIEEDKDRWSKIVKVLTIRDSGRSYEVQSENGRIYLRNRRLIKPLRDKNGEFIFDDDQSNMNTEDNKNRTVSNEDSSSDETNSGASTPRRSERIRNRH